MRPVVRGWGASVSITLRTILADFLLEHAANINTNWGTHEPASILHECAVHANYEAAQFLIDRGIDMTVRDYRWNATAEGWAYNAANDKNMAEFPRARRMCT